jgi:hypothetical protein
LIQLILNYKLIHLFLYILYYILNQVFQKLQIFIYYPHILKLTSKIYINFIPLQPMLSVTIIYLNFYHLPDKTLIIYLLFNTSFLIQNIVFSILLTFSQNNILNLLNKHLINLFTLHSKHSFHQKILFLPSHFILPSISIL